MLTYISVSLIPLQVKFKWYFSFVKYIFHHLFLSIYLYYDIISSVIIFIYWAGYFVNSCIDFIIIPNVNTSALDIFDVNVDETYFKYLSIVFWNISISLLEIILIKNLLSSVAKKVASVVFNAFYLIFLLLD